MIIENVFPPIPSEIIMPFAGFMTRRASCRLWVSSSRPSRRLVLGAL
jgi:membrane protein DedA with SNARE-associated domain